MTHGQNAPVGWGAYVAFRQTPSPVFVRQHGNTKHGKFTKQSRVDRLQFRWALAVLRGRWSGPPPWLSEAPPGWAAYRARTGQARLGHRPGR
jgi:hypothetical protein